MMEKVINDFSFGLLLSKSFLVVLLLAALFFAFKLYKQITGQKKKAKS
jgi:hypothetical protein